MNPDALSSPVVVAIISAGSVWFVTWLSMRDRAGRDDASHGTRLEDLERRVTTLESSTVTRREFTMLQTQIGEILSDVRDIRKVVMTP